MKRVIRWSVIIPAILAIYLGVMVVMGYDSYLSGATSPMLYFGGTVLVAVCIVLLHFHLRKRETMRKDKK